MQRWPLNHSAYWQEAPILRLLLPLVTAISCYKAARLPGLAALAGCVCSLLVFIVLSIPRRSRGWLPVVGAVLLQAALFCFGWHRVQSADITQRNDWLGNKNDSSLQLVRILDEPQEKEHTLKLRVAVLKQVTPRGAAGVTGEALLYVYRSGRMPLLKKGDRLLVPGPWERIGNAGNPFEFDYAAFCADRHIYHRQFLEPAAIRVCPGNGEAPATLMDRMYGYCRGSLDRYLTDSAARSLLRAMLLGDESGFDTALRDAYTATGVIHIVSISGSHVAMLFLIITSLLFWLKGRAGEWIRYLSGLVVVWTYILMAGAPPPALRSGLMFSIVALGVLCAQQPRPLNTLSAAAFILLCAQPSWLFTLGFQLSFAAVLSLLLFYRPVYTAWSWPHATRIGRGLWAAVSASIAAEVLTAPLSIYYFHSFPLWFIPANILAAVLLGFLALAGGIGIIAVSGIPFLAERLAAGITWLVSIFNHCIRMLQSWNPTSFRYLKITGPELLLLYACIALTAFALSGKRPRAGIAALAAGCLLLAMLCLDKLRVLGQEQLIVYNLGRHSVIDHISGNHYSSDGVAAASDRYALSSARTGFQAWRRKMPGPGAYYYFKRQKVLELKDELAVSDSTGLQADVLLITRSLKGLSPAGVSSGFRPRIVVIARSQPRYLLDLWRDSCVRLGIALHQVSRDGAFVLR